MSAKVSLGSALLLSAGFAVLFAACEPTPASSGADAATTASPDAALAPPDAAPPGTDAATAPDAAAPGPDAGGQPDAASPGPDAATPKPDASEPPDAAVVVPLVGFGTITGECGVLDTELTDADPHFFLNTLDFGTDQYDAEDLSKLTAGAQRVMTTPNQGGNSIVSEAFAVEMLVRCELATLLKTEREIGYSYPQGKITDELVQIDGLKVGVSVVRATDYPYTPFTETEARRVLEKKLQGVLDSSANVLPEDQWVKQVLYVLAATPTHAQTVRTVWDSTSAELRADTVVVVTVTEGADAPVYNTN